MNDEEDETISVPSAPATPSPDGSAVVVESQEGTLHQMRGRVVLQGCTRQKITFLLSTLVLVVGFAACLALTIVNGCYCGNCATSSAGCAYLFGTITFILGIFVPTPKLRPET